MAETKVHKTARQGAARKSIGTCACGVELIWAQLVLTRGRMVKECEKCGPITAWAEELDDGSSPESGPLHRVLVHLRVTHGGQGTVFEGLGVDEPLLLPHWQRPFLQIRCIGRRPHQRTRLTADGFPREYLARRKSVQGFQTGDLVQAVAPAGKHAGHYTGRVAVRSAGSFNIQTTRGTIQGVPARNCQLPQQADGDAYFLASETAQLCPPRPAASRACPDLGPAPTIDRRLEGCGT